MTMGHTVGSRRTCGARGRVARRPADLAAPYLSRVPAPTLLIAGGEDRGALGLNRAALTGMKCTSELHIVEHAKHLFEEPGALDEVIEVTTRWFHEWLRHPQVWQVGAQPRP